MSKKTIAQKLAEYSRDLRYADIPEDVVHEVKRRVIDSVGCVIGAFHSIPAGIARMAAMRVSGSASVIGAGIKTSPDLAAFANGVAVRYLDYNDTYLSREPAHPSDNISSCLAAAQSEGRTGKDMITAIVLAYEVQCRLCDAASLRAMGWDHVTYGAFSSGIAAAKLMGMDVEKTVHAIGLSGVANIALRQTRVGELSMWKGCAFANAGRNAVFAAMLAKDGMTGPSPIFEGEKGFMKLVSGHFKLDAFGGRKRHFKILDTYIKYYPAEYHSQSAIEAALALREEMTMHGLSPARNIKKVTVKTFNASYEIIGSGAERWRPKTRETADHSLPYCVAVALMDGMVGLDQFSEDRITDSGLIRFVQKISVVHDKSFDKEYPEAMPNLIEIIADNGMCFSRKINYPKGHPQNPLTDKEVEDKFRSLSGALIAPKDRDRILDMIWNLEKVKDLEALFFWKVGA